METVEQRKLSGMSKEAAKILASRKLILKIRKEAGLEDVDMDGFIREIDLGSRSQRDTGLLLMRLGCQKFFQSAR